MRRGQGAKKKTPFSWNATPGAFYQALDKKKRVSSRVATTRLVSGDKCRASWHPPLPPPTAPDPHRVTRVPSTLIFGASLWVPAPPPGTRGPDRRDPRGLACNPRVGFSSLGRTGGVCSTDRDRRRAWSSQTDPKREAPPPEKKKKVTLFELNDMES